MTDSFDAQDYQANQRNQELIEKQLHDDYIEKINKEKANKKNQNNSKQVNKNKNFGKTATIRPETMSRGHKHIVPNAQMQVPHAEHQVSDARRGVPKAEFQVTHAEHAVFDL